MFRKDWRSQPEYESWLLPVDDDATAARCTLCASTFTVKFDGVSAVKHHASTQKHKQKSLASKQSTALTKFFTPATSSAEDKVTAAELGTIFHGIKHNYSYLSMDCGSKLASKVFPDSDVACRMRLGRTKMEHLVKDVLAPYAVECIVEKLRPAGRNLPFTLSMDASNKGNRKLFPIAVRFYDVNGAGITDARSHRLLNVFVGRVFSVMGNLWTDERNQLSVPMELSVRYNLKHLCKLYIGKGRLMDIVHKLNTGEDYNVIKNNCQHWVKKLLEEMGIDVKRHLSSIDLSLSKIMDSKII
ncbi:hypothetical protein HPB47_002811 [Ixodes persulcatus]|uniref:Uncharacterized protein n=1 Tax=Ixodes persulcatus TaxID=34615 RepID=A0AC60PLB3_IXOPE|nr:hypothetical protein HPB47_002811 [Ixodes persulcatus]